MDVWWYVRFELIYIEQLESNSYLYSNNYIEELNEKIGEKNGEMLLQSFLYTIQ
jgi:hypothetical protein